MWLILNEANAKSFKPCFVKVLYDINILSRATSIIVITVSYSIAQKPDQIYFHFLFLKKTRMKEGAKLILYFMFDMIFFEYNTSRD